MMKLNDESIQGIVRLNFDDCCRGFTEDEIAEFDEQKLTEEKDNGSR